MSAVTPASGGQPSLAVGFDVAGALRARICDEGACDATGGRELALPPEARARASQTRLAIVPIGLGRHAVHVEVPEIGRGRGWEAVIVAPLSATRRSEPSVLFAGLTGFVQGQEGERSGPMVLVSAANEGGRRIVVGEQHEHLSLCGRPAVLAPKLLNPRDLQLHPAKVQRLSPAERAAARRVTAERAPQPEQRSEPQLLRAVAASSAIGRPDALTDGDPETTWSENRGGSGRGEFAILSAPAQLPLTELELVFRPARTAVPNGAAPREFYVATSHEVIAVTVPEDAWQAPGARYRVALSPPVRSGCLALVTESAYDEQAQTRVTFAELRARSEFDPSDVAALVGALAGGAGRAEAAAELLRALGEPAQRAVAESFQKLDEAGRRVALDVLDSAPCAISSSVYVQALTGTSRAQRDHARTRLRACASAASPLLEQALGHASPAAQASYASELALLAPPRAVRAIASLLAPAQTAEHRRLLRAALGRAARAREAESELRALLVDPALSSFARLELLRALGDRAAELGPSAAQAIARVAQASSDFRTRYLLLEPAAELAAQDAYARAYLRRALVNDASPHVRGQAARLSGQSAELTARAELRAALLAALRDAGPRVREAAAASLGERRVASAAPALSELLGRDRWPFVRARAAESLAVLAAEPHGDAALTRALEDESAHVRAPVARALGARRVQAARPALREKVEDRSENLEVRTAAATALGLMCDVQAVELLTRYAARYGKPLLDADQHALAPVALAALARIHPPDLRQRLAPLRGARSPRFARVAAERAERLPGRCGAAKSRSR